MKDKGRGREKGPGVWIIENKIPKRIPVTVGISDGNYTELLSGDIKEGQEIIVESLSKQRRHQVLPVRECSDMPLIEAKGDYQGLQAWRY